MVVFAKRKSSLKPESKMRYQTDGCHWLKVPFERREEAKHIGAMWDPLTKRWYLPAGTSLKAARKLGFADPIVKGK